MNLSTGKITVPGGMVIKGNAADAPLLTRGINGSDGSGGTGDLYINYTGGVTYFGTSGGATISADGKTYSGNAANVTGTVGIAHGGTGQTTAPNAINYLLNNGCTEGASPAQLNDYLIAQYAGGGTTTTTYHRRKISNVMKAFMPGVITVGTAAPSGGSNGDIYIQYS